MNNRKSNRTGIGSLSRQIVAAHTQHNAAKSGEGSETKIQIRSIGTEKKIRSAVKSCLLFIRKNYGVRNPGGITYEQAREYFIFRSRTVRQKQLNADRKAIQLALNIELPKLTSEVPEALKPRAYTRHQFENLMCHAGADLRLAMLLAWHSGLRAHELLRLNLPTEQPESPNRPWSESRFLGREEPFTKFTVVGKGGLCRTVAIRDEEACLLEEHPTPQVIRDREIYFVSRYRLLGGQALSQQFNKLSNWLFGWSCGFHGLRHSFAQRRISELMWEGFDKDQARQIVSCELGHFRPDITDAYLR